MMITKDNAKEGLRVHLLRPDPDYEIGPKNPSVDSKFHCPGYIEAIDAYGIIVEWANGNMNLYKDNELLCIDHNVMEEVEDKPGRCESIW